MTSTWDPAAMTPGERIAELATILATAYLRRLLRPQRALDARVEDEPSSPPSARGPAGESHDKEAA